MTDVLCFFYPTALAPAYGRRLKFVMAEHLATAKGENCAYGPTLIKNANSKTISPHCTCALPKLTYPHRDIDILLQRTMG